MSRAVLFVCEHGSAKSVLAATYFNQLAEQRGLAARGVARGINPDAELPPGVVAGLARAGLSPCLATPVALSDRDLDSAAWIVCFDQAEVAERAPTGTPLHAWDGLPPVSADFERASAAIAERVALVVEALEKEA
ncbi:MAG TPA: hypothetical protein VGQ69_02375 [Gemmatimonadales bacterium]|jgi:protein-tyrosine-phosphatase|nr:hypothetical protein [Gemmatimonadales bacterium]